ncbi:phytoene synthase [Allocatelliglobosispora scoriae]|uniref:Phytoene synthase n=1 Tax=Allocatelliglobosispora scoriae TaxID=643052 RepID=A0A841BM32_9ACTN|nr:squalene/phytoene synthase family protein [Allocatelliglobosispora scoriae]MBB5868316.1 phytoene synthase [Allocatelliglobosispora scoriae]
MTLSSGYAAVSQRMVVREPVGYLIVRLLMPRMLQRHALAVAWFVCATDDIVDNGPRERRPARFTAWDRQVRAGLALDGPVAGAKPELAAFLHTVRECRLTDTLVHECLDGLRDDLHFTGVRSEQDFQAYVDRVTMPLLQLIMAVHPQARGPEFTTALRHLGEACQRIDILDDLASDLRAGRLFLPADELAGIGVTPEDLFAGRVPAQLHPVLAEWARRAREGLVTARCLLTVAPRELRPLIDVIVRGHEARLAGLERAGLRLVRRRVLPPILPALRIVTQGMMRRVAGRVDDRSMTDEEQSAEKFRHLPERIQISDMVETVAVPPVSVHGPDVETVDNVGPLRVSHT